MPQWIRAPVFFWKDQIFDLDVGLMWPFRYPSSSDTPPGTLMSLHSLGYHPVCRYFGHALWRVTALASFLGINSDMRVRERPSHVPVSVTASNALEQYSYAELRDRITDTATMLRELPNTSGQPAGFARAFCGEFINQLRAVLRECYEQMWNESPLGPGASGAVFGARCTEQNDAGDRVPVGIFGAQGQLRTMHVCHGGGVYLTDPLKSPWDGSSEWDATHQWDYVTETLPVFFPWVSYDRLKPQTGPNDGWNHLLDRMKRRRGTTINAGDPPDVQNFSEFNSHHGEYRSNCASGQIEAQSPLPIGDFDHVFVHGQYVAGSGVFYPPMGTGPIARSIWQNNRNTGRRKHFTDPLGFEWGSLGQTQGTPPAAHSTISSGHYLDSPGQIPPGKVGGRFFHRHVIPRLGWEIDVSGKPWKLTWHHWFAELIGADPINFFVRMRFNWHFVLRYENYNPNDPGEGITLNFSIAFGHQTMVNDETAIRSALGGGFATNAFLVKSATLSVVAQSGGDLAEERGDEVYDFPIDLRNYAPGDGGWYFHPQQLQPNRIADDYGKHIEYQSAGTWHAWLFARFPNTDQFVTTLFGDQTPPEFGNPPPPPGVGIGAQ